ncbi:MAG: NADH:flavin oxidoreductase [Desulfobacca sp.]|nr:NADH:flavin oxidoreductase [Desulfobacca sp.]
MSKLFEATEINGMKLANRFVRSATWEGMAEDDGSVTPKLIDLMTQLAKGQVGLIISSHAYIKPEGQAGLKQIGVYKDELIDGLRRMTQAVHDQGGRIVLQLAHAGYFANSKLTGQIPLAASQVEQFSKSPRKEMTIQDIQEVIEAFGLAAQRAKEAGFDGVQIHAAHGYLMSQFLSPLFNKRSDAYGGSAENRARALREIIKKVRSVVGERYPVLIKLNNQDYLEGGLALEDSLKIGPLLQEEGLDAIELSGGTFLSGNLMPSRVGIAKEEKEAYFQEAAKAFKEKLKIPLMLVGGVRSLPVAERIVNQGVADYLSMSRPFIREPELIKRWKSGDQRKAFCLSDNQCFGPAMAGEGIYCVVEKKEKEKALNSNQN